MRMKALFRPAILLLAPLLLLGATDEKPRLTFQGLGSIEIGMSEAVLQKRGFSDPDRSAVSQADLEYAACHYLSNETEYPGVHLMINDGLLVRIDIGANDAAIVWKTLSGASIGMTETEVVSLYDGWIKIDHHPYLDDAGSYLILDSSEGLYKMIFETATSDGSGEQFSSEPSRGPNANKRVTDFRAGLAGPVNYIEGCS